MAMRIEPHTIRLAELFEGYRNDGENGAVAYGGRLICRPPYQREFVYKPKQQEEVVNTILKGFPLNSIYWIVNDDGTFELLDGQQRTLSICEYMDGAFSTDFRGDIISYGNIRDKDRGRQFRDYEMQVYFCSDGTDEEKLEWFKVLNIAGEKLNAQEGRNAVYHGPFVSDARRLFSKSNCPATKNDWDKLMKGSPIRQDYLETVLKWKAAEEGKSIEQYMSAHAQDEDAGFLFEYYERVMNWVYSVFPKNYYRREMQQGVDWGLLYHKFHQQYYDAKEMEERVAKLMANDEVKNKKGIYTFVFDGDESSLNLRQFSASEKRVLYERCEGFCKRCGPKIHYKIEEMEADHIKPWSDGGKTELDNGQMLCKHHNRVKGNK